MGSTRTVIVNHWDGRTSRFKLNLPWPTDRPLRINDLSADEFETCGVALHEAAHSVVGVIHGGKLLHAFVGGHPLYDDMAGGAKFTRRPDRADLMFLAGSWATAKWNAGGRRRPTLREVERVIDGHEIDRNELVASGATAGAVFGELSNLLERCWPVVTALAAKLYPDKQIEHADVCDALGIPARDNAFHLALLRSGSAPGSFNVTVPTAV